MTPARLALLMHDHQSALHNSGAGPRAIYRTAPVGSVHLLDLFAELQQFVQLFPLRLRRRFRPVNVDLLDRLPVLEVIPAATSTPADVVQVVTLLLAALTPTTRGATRRASSANPPDHATEAEAIAALVALRTHLETLGALGPVTALVSWVHRSDYGSSPFIGHVVGQPLPWLRRSRGPKGPLLRLAWIILAVSHAAPPLVRFTRTPSLRYWRPDGALSVRWIGELAPSRSTTATDRRDEA